MIVVGYVALIIFVSGHIKVRFSYHMEHSSSILSGTYFANYVLQVPKEVASWILIYLVLNFAHRIVGMKVNIIYSLFT